MIAATLVSVALLCVSSSLAQPPLTTQKDRYSFAYWQGPGPNQWRYSDGLQYVGAVPNQWFVDQAIKGKNDFKNVSVTLQPGETSNIIYMASHNTTNFIPDNAVIKGFRLFFWRRASAVGLVDVFFGISNKGSLLLNSNKCPTGGSPTSPLWDGTCTWPATFPVGPSPHFGTYTDLWNIDWSRPTDLNTDTWALAIQTQNTGTTPVDAFLDEAHFEYQYVLSDGTTASVVVPATTSSGSTGVPATTSTGVSPTGGVTPASTTTGDVPATTSTGAVPATTSTGSVVSTTTGGTTGSTTSSTTSTGAGTSSTSGVVNRQDEFSGASTIMVPVTVICALLSIMLLF